MIFQHHTARITPSEAVYGRAGCIIFQRLQYERAGCIHFNSKDVRGESFSTGSSMYVQGVSTAISMEVQILFLKGQQCEIVFWLNPSHLGWN
jgi:hypothetical protein